MFILFSHGSVPSDLTGVIEIIILKRTDMMVQGT
jgi:hypothetical protein